MNTQNYDAIRNAIEQKQQVIAMYQGHLRKMCPHVMGTKNGRIQALFYQFGGTSSSGTITPGSTANWRCIPIEGLTDVQIIDGEWFTGNNHSQPQTCIDTIHVEVSL